MNIEKFRNYCLSMPYVEEGFPVDQTTIVFKVKGKMFALTDIDSFERINVKCNPEKAIELREEYDEVIPGFHMNKKHWNSLIINASLSDEQIEEWVKESYDIIVKSLPKKVQKEML